MKGDRPECVLHQIGCDRNDICGDHGTCVPESYADYVCACNQGYEFDAKAGSCLPKTSIYRKVHGEKAFGDDAISSASCDVVEVVMRCHTFGAPSAADGVTIHVEDDIATCIARASNALKFPVMAVAYCGSAPKVIDPCDSDLIGTIEYRYGTGANPSVSCPDGYLMDSCMVWSPVAQDFTATTKAKISSLSTVAMKDDGSCNIECLTEKTTPFCKLTAICKKLTGLEYRKSACPTCEQVACPTGEQCEMMSDIPTCIPRVSGSCEAHKSRVHLGYWRDKKQRAISGGIRQLPSDVDSCEAYAEEQGWSVFALEDGGECFTSATAHTTYQQYGRIPPEACVKTGHPEGLGGRWCMEVYRIDTVTKCGDGKCAVRGADYTCTCGAGYLFKGTCVDEDECQQLPCGNGECTNTPGSYRCACNPGYAPVRGTCVDINECNDNPCGANERCSNTEGSYMCGCLDTFTLDPTSRECVCADGFRAAKGGCVDVDECQETPCGENQKCLNSVGNYRCECNTGFEKVDGAVCEEINVKENCDLVAATPNIKAFRNTKVRIKFLGETKKKIKKNTRINWVRNGEFWLPIYDGKNKANGFVISHFGPEDAGQYTGKVFIDEDGGTTQCTVRINIQMIEGKVELRIANKEELAKPQLAGKKLAIGCDVTTVNVKLDDPRSPDNVNWYKISPNEAEEDEVIDDSTNISIIRKRGMYQLVFVNPTPADSGTYRCTFDRQGVDASTDVTIEVVHNI